MKVLIRPECYAEIDYYVQNSPNKDEISGLGRVVKHDDGTMEVVKIYFLPQQMNSGGTTDIDGEAVAKLMYETRNDEGNLNFWWHSHVDMNVFWSGTDHATIKKIGGKGYVLATVFNRAKEMRSAYYQGGTSFLPPVFVDDLDTTVGMKASAEEVKVWSDKIDVMKAYELANKPKRNKLWSQTSKFGTGLANNFDMNGNWRKDNQGFNTYDPYTTPNGVPKRDKRGRKKKYDSQAVYTILGDKMATKEDYVELLNTYLTQPQQQIWYDCLVEISDEREDLEVSDLWEFYERFDGDQDEMEKHVLNEMSANFQSNDPAILGVK